MTTHAHAQVIVHLGEAWNPLEPVRPDPDCLEESLN